MKKIICGIIVMMMGVMAVGMPVVAASCRCCAKWKENNPETGECESVGGEGLPTGVLGEPAVNSDGSLAGGNCSCDDGNGSGVTDILELVVEIMTIGVGILGVVGITIVGLQYLTAGGNEEQTRKAKRRMVEIVIGLVVYVVMFAVLKWVVPDFNPFP